MIKKHFVLFLRRKIAFLVNHRKFLLQFIKPNILMHYKTNKLLAYK